MDHTLPLLESESMVMVRDAARDLLAREWPPARAVAQAADPAALLRVTALAAEQGWTALSCHDPELGLNAAIALMQELGRAACPLPLMDAVLANTALAGVAAVAGLRAGIAAGTAIVTWAFGRHGGDADGGDVVLRGLALTGSIGFVENSAIATHFLILTGIPGEIAIVARDASGLTITPTPGLAKPALAELVFDATPAQVVRTSVDLAQLPALGRLLLAARATGSAQYGLELLTDYVKVRKQFGKLIGTYQAIQHKLADCLIGIDACRLAQLRAANAAPGAQAYPASVAAALAGQLLRRVVLELHHGFGGISFWHEHELPRHFHRIHGDLTRLGGVRVARREVAAAVLHAGGIPVFSYGSAADAFRAEVRAWLDQNWDGRYAPELLRLPVNERKARPEFSRKLAAQGWLSLSWPRETGGQGRSTLESLAYEEELAYRECPVTWHNVAANMIGPALIRHGNAGHREKLVPAIAAGDVSFALGYSEPDHGSDLASIRTSATQNPDGTWTIRGQKIFTSATYWATHLWIAVRTNPDNPRHGGISVFVIPMNAPGISAQRMHGLSDHSAAVTFYDDVIAPSDALVGELHGGWKVITDALAFERVAMGAIGARARAYFDRIVAHVRTAVRDGVALADDPLVLDQIGMLAAEVEASRLFAVRTAQQVQRGQTPVVEAGMLKVYSSELMERLCETAFDILGTGAALKAGLPRAIGAGGFEFGVRDALQFTIGGGTNEIMRSLIARQALDLPR